MSRRTGKTGSNSKAEVEKNKRLAAQRIAEGATRAEVQVELGVCRQTLGNYLQGLNIDWAALNAPAIAPLKKKMVEQLLQMADDVIAGVVSTKLADTWRGLMSDIREMLPGMNAPTTSVTAHIGTAQLDPLYLDVRAVLQDLEEEDQQAGLEVLREFARSRVKPLTLDAVPQLSDGGEGNG